MKYRTLALLLALAGPAGAQQLKDGAMAVEQNEAVVTILAVDVAKKEVVIRGPRGNVETLQVPQESQNLDKVKQGDRFKLRYIEAVAVSISHGGAPEQSESQDVKVSPKGGTPGGAVARTMQVTGVIDAIDYKNRYVAIRGPGQQTLALPVSPEVKDFDSLKAGDTVTLGFVQALAIKMLREGKPAKAAPKKKS